MSLFSFLRKNKQQSASGDSAFYSRSDDEPGTARARGKRRQGKGGDSQPDPILPEKKRARRRLIGVVALVLAAVVGLPMLLDSEPKPLTGDIAIQIPSKDKAPLPAPVLPGGTSSAPKTPAANRQDPEAAGEPAATPVKAVSQKAEVVPAAKPQANENPKPAMVPAPAKPAVPEKHAASEHHAPNPAETKAEADAAARAEDAARARALLAGKPDPLAAEKNGGKFVVQVAALATREKVDELRARLKNAGIRTYTQKVATVSGDRIRIRVGPFSNRDEAEKMRAKIVKLGLNGVLVPV